MQEAAEGALKDLQLGYLDLWLMHWPVTGNKGPSIEPPIKETWEARPCLPSVPSNLFDQSCFMCCMARDLLQGGMSIFAEQTTSIEL